MKMPNHQQSIRSEIEAIYIGIKNTPGNRDNLPKNEHEFIVPGTGQSLRFKEIKLLKKASPKKDKRYILGFDIADLSLLVSIVVDGITYLRETNNRIVSIDKIGNKVNLSDRPVVTALGRAKKEYSKKLIAEGKTPIKPIRRRW